jgi:hypothetical protein
MHRGHDDHHHGDGGLPPGPGHNRPRAAQWQTPHIAGDRRHGPMDGEPDLDLVEAAFVDGFATASDPTSFLRLAQVPFEAAAADGTRLMLLRVEIDALTDVGTITPHFGGASFRYDPLPARMATRRRRLRFAYFDGTGVRALALGEVRALLPTAIPGAR